MTKYVFDASALLALINREEGAEEVEKLLHHSIMSSVNVSECAAILSRIELPQEKIKNLLTELIPEIIPFEVKQAFETARLRKMTKEKGLSLGDRACLALGSLRNLPVVTADRVWKALGCGVKIHLIR